jgi:hypothetical protein
MDYLCGRLVTYDEIPNDFASEYNDRIEYWKSITVRFAPKRPLAQEGGGVGGLLHAHSRKDRQTGPSRWSSAS